jgi:hypothetical protein
MRPLAAIVMLALAAAGCDGPAAPRTVQSIDHIMLEAAPSAVNLDEQPGPDGFEVRVTLFRQDAPLPVALEGVLEMTMYDAVVEGPALAEATPQQIWRFDRHQLRRFAVPARANVGIAYGMSLYWGANPPQRQTVTLAARWRRPNGSYLYSDPVTVHIAP